MSDMSGFFQVEQVLLPKLNGGKLKGMVRIEVYGPGGDLVASLSWLPAGRSAPRPPARTGSPP